MLEDGSITYPVCEKLSVLYTIIDHHDNGIPEEMPEPRIMLDTAPRSEFLQKVNGAPIDQVLQIVDKHMECVKVLYPKEYNMIIHKIEEL